MSVDGSDANDSIYEYYLLDDVKKSKIRSSNNSRRLIFFIQAKATAKTRLKAISQSVGGVQARPKS